MNILTPSNSPLNKGENKYQIESLIPKNCVFTPPGPSPAIRGARGGQKELVE